MSDVSPLWLQRNPDLFSGVASGSEALYISVFTDYHIRRLFHSTVSDPQSSNLDRTVSHSTGYRNPEFDALIDEAVSSFDDDLRKRNYDQAQEIVWNDAPHVWLFNKVDGVAINKALTDFIELGNQEIVIEAIKVQ